MNPDRELLDELVGVLDQVDPVPPLLAEAAGFPPPQDFVPFTWLSDSAVAVPAGTRGGGGSRALRFSGDGTTVDLRLDSVDGLGVRALGLVHPPRGGSVLVSWAQGSAVCEIDLVGWFRAEVVPNGPLRFVVRQPGSPELSTRWFVQ
ncbi:MAG: hypothetical protein ABIQ18_17440 [Umezawaea sp.]